MDERPTASTHLPSGLSLRDAFAIRGFLTEREAAGRSGIALRSDAGELPLPEAAERLLLDLLEDLASGARPTIAPFDMSIGTMEATRLLGVSRTWLARLIDRGDIEGSMTGSKRRIMLGNLMAAKRARAQHIRDASNALADIDDRLEAETFVGRTS